MKRLGLVLVLMVPILLFSQEDNSKKSIPDSLKPWQKEGSLSITTNQTSLTNWAAGGESSVSASAILLYDIDYKDSLQQWDNSLKLGYGVIWQDESGRDKSDDVIDISSKYGYKGFDAWYYSAEAGFSTQFDKGYNSDSAVISEFMAPGYLTVALGMDYKPNDALSVLIAPLSGKATYVLNDSLAQTGAYGLDEAVYDETTGELLEYTNSKYEFGGSIKISYKKKVMPNVQLTTKLNLFSNYLENPENVDIKWDLDINMKVNKYITASISTKMIYDDDIKIGVDDNDDGEITDDETYPRLQFKEVVGVGIAFTF